jgi:hypothetical protein
VLNVCFSSFADGVAQAAGFPEIKSENCAGKICRNEKRGIREQMAVSGNRCQQSEIRDQEVSAPPITDF